MLVIYSITHFLVDFSCAFILLNKVYERRNWYLYFLLYNFCAFAMQMVFGLLADVWNRNAIFAAIGCVLIIISYGFVKFPLAIALISGVGNGMFHIGGGIDVLNISTEKSSALGIFISPGAFGIYFGKIAGKQDSVSEIIIIMALILAVISILIRAYADNKLLHSDNQQISFNGLASKTSVMCILIFFVVVCLRSYVGMISNFSWKNEWHWALILTCALVFGKCFGGILADRIGYINASVISLGLSAILFLLSDYPIAGILAVFLFNMTMPITLWAIAKLLAGCKGFAFGILTFGLFLGILPTYFEMKMIFNLAIVLSLSALVSLILLLPALKKGR